MRPEAGNLEPAGPRERFAPRPGGALLVAAPAKLNLDLHVGPRRDDGYHGLDSIVVKVSLYDEVLLTPHRDGRITLRCTGCDCGPDERNIALLAARRLADRLGAGSGVGINLRKAIPPGMGLGGGSSDAAAVLEGLARLWSAPLSPADLADLAAGLGSDVPLFLGPPAARMTGRGERIEPVEVHPFVALLHMPAVACPTGQVYAAFDARPDRRPGLPPRRELPLADAPPSRWRGRLRNDLAGPAMAVEPRLRAIRDALAAATGLPVGITGSGAGMFLLCDDRAEAAAAMRRLPKALRARTVCVVPNPW